MGVQSAGMTEDAADVGLVIRRAIGGDSEAATWLVTAADTTGDPVVIAMAALLERRPERLDNALSAASTSRDRQLVAIIRAHLRGDHALVDALARDHLVDHPGSFIVSWIASDPVAAPTDPGRP
jgi:hypothetical protein